MRVHARRFWTALAATGLLTIAWLELALPAVAQPTASSGTSATRSPAQPRAELPVPPGIKAMSAPGGAVRAQSPGQRARGQSAAPQKTAAPGPAQAAVTPASSAQSVQRGPYRRLAPGVEITISPERQEEETFSTHDIIEVLQGIPNLNWTPKVGAETHTLREMATGTVFRRAIWGLEFTFKPVRMIWVDVPQPSGRMQRKLVWYLLYHVKNTGAHLKPVQQPDGTYIVHPINGNVRFIPQFVLEAREYNKAYLDRIIPVAKLAIQLKEDPSRPLLNSAEISAQMIPVSSPTADHSVWGVATWEDIDPRTDFFSVYIQGLTNAYKWVDPPGAYKPGDPPGTGRVLLAKTLMLNFWRPGDEFTEDQRLIRFGIPGQVDYRWVYR